MPRRSVFRQFLLMILSLFLLLLTACLLEMTILVLIYLCPSITSPNTSSWTEDVSVGDHEEVELLVRDGTKLAAVV